ncbi:carbohydrate esterase family 5 protein [Talaromyces proteolyticus]|uniref:cutinase n=1 Tax=Talaromyces proteolyticus TaxID=1131652 RepID=A0AAD4KF65_9EURO|nr:carbohydrate esterase family 5 protein [Talaromyces proteolyticus]KAH8689500.1 carbohydrate esterase family 5 protein [Talaromyces proteolyticus]
MTVATQKVNDNSNGMIDIIEGNAECASIAVIFARGTFDSGNIGVWVGPQFFEELSSRVPSAALQGVDPDAYKADLYGYLSEGGSDDGAVSLASTVNDYNSKCPDSVIVISGWSQGALVAHKALEQISSTALDKTAALVTFGDPNGVWNNTALPESIPSSSFSTSCVTGTIFDPLCAQIPSDFKFPTSLSDIVGPFASLPNVAVGIQQAEAAANLAIKFPAELAASWEAFVSNLTPQQFVRLMLTPQHFTYGNNGMASQAADFVAGLAPVQNSQ